MNEEAKTFQRWYDKDPIVSKCVRSLETLDKRKQHQVATFLMEEIINQLPDDVYDKIVGENRKRRWYDFDEVCKIFIELLRYSPDEIQKQIALKIILFMEDNE